MVDQSELPYRLLCRKYGATICYTPMIHTKMVCTVESYQRKFLGTWLDPMDRPLIAQLAGSDPAHVLQAAQFVEPYVDGIDINCGCPQNIAKRGQYGAFLLEQEETLLPLVKHLVKHLKKPLSVKVRLIPPPELASKEVKEAWDIPQRSLELYTKLIDAGVHMLTIHGRTRHQKSVFTGHSDWKTIRWIIDQLGHRVPIIANGSIGSYQDIVACMEETKADGIMSSEAVLEYPPLFHMSSPDPVRSIGRLQLAQEYIDLARQYPPNKGGQGSGMKCMRTHIHRFLHADLQNDAHWRSHVVNIETLDGLQECVDYFREKHRKQNHKVEDEQLSWYMRHRSDPEAVRERLERNSQIKCHELDDHAAESMGNMFSDNLNECGRVEDGDY